jgi:CrcB protein
VGFILVFIGSGIGGMARHGVGLLSLRWFGPGFPTGTLAINIVGSAAMGVVVALFASLDTPHPGARLFLTTGIIGGFTTFSTFSLDAVALWQRGAHASAAFYVIASILVSLVALTLSMLLVRRFV